MTAKHNRANEEPQNEPREEGQDPEAARSQSNAKAAAEEAARLAEEAAQAEGEKAKQAAGDAEPSADADSSGALQQEIDDLRERLQRAMAETENVRRRAERERQETMKYAAAPLAKDLLGVADNLRRALDSVSKDQAAENPTLQTLLSGVEMTEKELNDALSKHGVQPVEANPGERFDPHSHEAMYEVPTDEQAPGTIVHVVQTGYKLHDRLLRPARVGVAKSAGGGQGGQSNGSGQNVDMNA